LKADSKLLAQRSFNGRQFFWAIFCGAIIDYDQRGLYPENWSKKDWDEVELALRKGGREAFNAANPLLDQNNASPEQKKQAKQILDAGFQEFVEEVRAFRLHAQRIPEEMRAAYWDGLRHFARQYTSDPDRPVKDVGDFSQHYQTNGQAIALKGLADFALADWIKTPSTKLLLNLNGAISRGLFQKNPEISQYPSADIGDKDLKAHAELRPTDISLEQAPIPEEAFIKAMEEIASLLKKRGTEVDDAGKVLMHLWGRNKNPDGWATVSLNEICAELGLKERRGHGGYEPAKKDAIRASVDRLTTVKMFVRDLPEAYGIKGRVKTDDPYIIIRNRVMPDGGDQQELFGRSRWEAISFQPGLIARRVIEVEKQFMFLPRGLLALDSYRFRATKLLGAKLTELFRINAKNGHNTHPLRVKTLLNYAETPLNKDAESELSKILDTLSSKQVKTIKGWSPETTIGEMKSASGKERVNEKLLANWAETMVTIEVPDELVTQYKTIAENRPKPIALPQERQDLSEALNEAMLTRNKKTEETAAEIGISTGTLSKVRNGGQPTMKVAQKIRDWLDGVVTV
jgi:hypothetical protein